MWYKRLKQVKASILILQLQPSLFSFALENVWEPLSEQLSGQHSGSGLVKTCPSCTSALKTRPSTFPEVGAWATLVWERPVVTTSSAARFFPHKTQDETHTSLETTQAGPLTTPWPVGWPWGGDSFVSGLNLACESCTSFLSNHWIAKAESKYKAVSLTPGTWPPCM